MADEPELWIVGAGPAALLLADATIERGVTVGLLAPELREPWPRNYGLWLDDAEALGIAHYLRHRWNQTEIRLAAGPRLLGRGYALLDDRAMQLDILARCEAAGVRFVSGRLAALQHDDEGVDLHTEHGERLRGRLVVDASGHASPWIAREDGPACGHQIAWGELLQVEEPLDLAAMTFMDWSSTGVEERDEALPPTFLYAMPFASDRLFVQETVLTARVDRAPADYFEALERRLHRRLDRMAIRRVGAPIAIERCVIPMGGPLPRADQRTLAFGGSAGMVHPATGYMLTNVLRRRMRVADAIAKQLRTWAGPPRASRAIWQAIWPAQQVRAWRLYGFGMEILAGLDRPGLDRFFDQFFELPEPRWRGFVSASSSTTELTATMLRYFAVAPAELRRRLAIALVGQPGRRMARGFASPR
jgi:lycopene cyclase-like protein